MRAKQKLITILTKKVEAAFLLKVLATITSIVILISLYRKGVIAPLFINGEPVTLSEILIALNDKEKESFLDRLIAEKIVAIEARKRNIQVRNEEINAEVSKIEKQALDDGKTLVQLLKESDQTAEDLEKDVKLRITIYKIIEQDFDVSEDEIDQFIYENRQLYTGRQREEIREEVKELLLLRKFNDQYATFLQEAKANVEIDYFVKF